MSNEINNFYDLDAWKKGHRLTLAIYEITKGFPQDERFGITSQLRRAASSVTANIAEGFGRYHFKDKARFYHQARGSLAEVQNFVILATDLGYLVVGQREEILEESNDVRKLINGLIRCVEVKLKIS